VSHEQRARRSDESAPGCGLSTGDCGRRLYPRFRLCGSASGHTVETGHALYQAVCEHGPEGQARDKR
jgi:hypothetical protein